MSTKKRKYPTDKEVGIRSMTEINNLPVRELTDSEICKLFFHRFDAEALVMAYVDKQGIQGTFGRLRTEKAYRIAYLQLSDILNRLDIPFADID